MLPAVQEGIEKSLAALNAYTGGSVYDAPVVGPGVAAEDLLPTELRGEWPIDSGDVVSKRMFVYSLPYSSVGLHHFVFHGVCDGIRLQDLAVRNATKWASRSYRMRSDNRVERCAFFNTHNEHDIYWNLAGYNRGLLLKDGIPLSVPTLVLRACYFEDTGSQNVQLVQRPIEQGFDCKAAGDLTPGGPIVMSDCLSRNAGRLIGDGNARAAFALSGFETKNNVVITRFFVDKSMQPKSTGSLLLERHPLAQVRGSVFLSGDNQQAIASVQGCGVVTFNGSTFHAAGGQNWIDVKDTKHVSFTNCVGDAHIHWNKQDVGRVDVDWQS